MISSLSVFRVIKYIEALTVSISLRRTQSAHCFVVLILQEHRRSRRERAGCSIYSDVSSNSHSYSQLGLGFCGKQNNAFIYGV